MFCTLKSNTGKEQLALRIVMLQHINSKILPQSKKENCSITKLVII